MEAWRGSASSVAVFTLHSLRARSKEKWVSITQPRLEEHSPRWREGGWSGGGRVVLGAMAGGHSLMATGYYGEEDG